jgi:Phosphate-selective porin O and P
VLRGVSGFYAQRPDKQREVPCQQEPLLDMLSRFFLSGAWRSVFLSDHCSRLRMIAVFDCVIPRRNFNVGGEEDGWGARQVGVPYRYLDLQDKGVNGATPKDVVLGLNWFRNPNIKVQWNVALDHRDATPTGSNGWTYICGACLALDF